MLSVPITTSSTDYTSSGSPNDNKATWTLGKSIGYFTSTDAQSTTPWYNNDSYGVGSSVMFSYQYTLSSNVVKSINFSSKFYASAVTNNGTYVTKYLTFLHDVDSSIIVTP